MHGVPSTRWRKNATILHHMVLWFQLAKRAHQNTSLKKQTYIWQISCISKAVLYIKVIGFTSGKLQCLKLEQKKWVDFGQKSIIFVSYCKLISFISNFEPQTHFILTADPTILVIGSFLQCSWWTLKEGKSAQCFFDMSPDGALALDHGCFNEQILATQ